MSFFIRSLFESINYVRHVLQLQVRMRKLYCCYPLIRKPYYSLGLGSYLILIPMSFNLLHQELVEFIEISFIQLFFELNLLVPSLCFCTTQKIYWKLITHIVYVVLIKWYEIILSSSDASWQIDEWNLRTRLECVHLNLHVFFKVPSENIVLQGISLSIDELNDLMMRGCQDLRYHSMV